MPFRTVVERVASSRLGSESVYANRQSEYLEIVREGALAARTNYKEQFMALPFGPRFRLRRNHACGAFPPFGFNR